MYKSQYFRNSRAFRFWRYKGLSSLRKHIKSSRERLSKSMQMGAPEGAPTMIAYMYSRGCRFIRFAISSSVPRVFLKRCLNLNSPRALDRRFIGVRVFCIMLTLLLHRPITISWCKLSVNCFCPSAFPLHQTGVILEV